LDFIFVCPSVQLSVISLESAPELLDTFFKTHYLWFALKVVGKVGFSAILTHNKHHFPRGHRRRFTGKREAIKSDM
jgi:hypothetical protein